MKLLKVLRSTMQFEPDLILICFFGRTIWVKPYCLFAALWFFENWVNAEFKRTLWFSYGQYGSQCSNVQYGSVGQYGLAYLNPPPHPPPTLCLVFFWNSPLHSLRCILKIKIHCYLLFSFSVFSFLFCFFHFFCFFLKNFFLIFLLQAHVNILGYSQKCLKQDIVINYLHCYIRNCKSKITLCSYSCSVFQLEVRYQPYICILQ